VPSGSSRAGGSHQLLQAVDGPLARARPAPRARAAAQSRPARIPPPAVPPPCAPQSRGPDVAPPSSLPQAERGSTPSTDCTAPNVTPAASRRVRQSARSRWAKTVSSTCTSALACALRAALVAKRGSAARSGRPIAARNPRHCRGSLNSAKMFQRCWSAMFFGCTRVRAPFNPIE
jgi:hypothetical protein